MPFRLAAKRSWVRLYNNAVVAPNRRRAMSSPTADIGLIGLAVMGENLVLNMESRGYTVAVFNRTLAPVDDFLAGRAKGKKIVRCHSVKEVVAPLKQPRKVLIMVKAAPAVAQV